MAITHPPLAVTREQEHDLARKIRWRDELTHEWQQTAEEAARADKAVQQALEEFGYGRESVRLLHLVPLVQVAWAEGTVTRRERQLILEAARLRGVAEGSRAHERLLGWLDFKPTEEFYEKSLILIRAILRSLPPDERAACRHDLISLCTRVAEVSGGGADFPGGGRMICDEEVELVKSIAAELNREMTESLLEMINLSEVTGLTDPSILRALHEAGFTTQTVQLLPLIPLVQVAWAEGTVTRRERQLIMVAARLRGLRAGSPAYEKLAEWLEERPPEGLFDKSLRAMKAVLELLPDEMREIEEDDLLSYCVQVAEASDLGADFDERGARVSRDERQVLTRLAAGLRA